MNSRVYYWMAKVGPRGGIKESPKAPKSDTPNPDPKGQGTAGGSATGKRGADVSAANEKTLQSKVDDFNDKESNTKYGKATLGVLKSVFQRGLGAYNTSRSPKVISASQWAFARVNAFLYLLKNGRPQNPKYDTDYDLLPKEHPKVKKVDLKRKSIPFNRFYEFLTSGEEVIVYWSNLSGQSLRRRMVYGPFLGGALYDYEADGYMVMDDLTKGNWRTVVLDNVTSISYRGDVYNVQQ